MLKEILKANFNYLAHYTCKHLIVRYKQTTSETREYRSVAHVGQGVCV